MAQSISQEAIGATGLPGATAASRHAGATASGAPTTGTFAVGDFVVDQSGNEWVCTVAGTPGTWVALRNATQLQGTAVSSTAPTSNQVLTYNSGTTSWTPTTPAAGALTTASSYITSNFTTTGGAYNNVTSLSLTAGTWLITYSILMNNGNTSAYDAFLSTTSASITGVFSGTSGYFTSSQIPYNMNLTCFYTTASTQTIYLNIYTVTATTVFRQAYYNGIANTFPTGIMATKIA